uniref:Uncharacterized protein n=1 Tax=Cyprinodon variegatus TaxID=28743 RepID=A0A3Q2DZ48_CYPVA
LSPPLPGWSGPLPPPPCWIHPQIPAAAGPPASNTTESTHPPSTTEPTDPSRTTEPTHPASTTESTHPPSTTEPTNPSKTTEPTHPPRTLHFLILYHLPSSRNSLPCYGFPPKTQL